MLVLEGKKIPYETVTYPNSERDAEKIAALLDVPADQLFKTLVVTRPPAKPLLVMLPANGQLDLKKLAAFVGEKKLKMAAHQEAEQLTGLQVGGISPLALLNKRFMMLIDESVGRYDQIYISAGQRGINLKLPTAALIKLTNARQSQFTVQNAD
jgi:Cys-tRNA(Pro)/Cys-tRNA(Cys) deacylase